MLSLAFGSLASKSSAVHRPIHSSAAFRRATRAFGSLMQLHPAEEPPVEGSSDQKLAALKSIGGECVTVGNLERLLKKKPDPVCYAWYDPTPWMHITQGITLTLNVNKLVRAGCKVKILMADWFAQADHKIVSKAGSGIEQVDAMCSYNIETWRAAGMDLDGVEFVRLSDEIGRNTDTYWPLAMDVARTSGVTRIQRWLRAHALEDPRRGYEPLDRYARRDFTAADILRPCLQCAAMMRFQNKADVWLLGLDQRAAYMLSRQYLHKHTMADRDEESRYTRPVALFHNELPNLFEYPECESPFDTRWAIFMEDGKEGIVSSTMYSAFCPASSSRDNPCLEYVRHIVLPWFGKFEVARKEENGGTKTFSTMEEINADYESGALRPDDVKESLVSAIEMMLRPVHEHFRSSDRGREVIKAVRRFHVVGWVA